MVAVVGRMRISHGVPGFHIDDLLQARHDVGPDVKIPFLIDSGYLAQFLDRPPGDEIRQWHLPVGREYLQAVECGKHSVIVRKPDTDFYFLVRGFDPHCVQQNAARHQLHHAAHRCDIRAEASGLFDVDVDLPVNARQRQRIIDVDQPCCFLELRPGSFRRGLQFIEVFALQSEMDRLSVCRTAGEVQEFRPDAGNFR